jgi:hypothetical protein
MKGRASNINILWNAAGFENTWHEQDDEIKNN